jgi:hypothetical protein
VPAAAVLRESAPRRLDLLNRNWNDLDVAVD